MKTNSRRHFLKSVVAGSMVMLSGIPAKSWGADAHVVVVGGGTAGATFAKYLKKADPSIRVTIIEKNATYHTCYMSNEVLGGGRELSSLAFTYDDLRRKYGIEVLIDEVTGLNSQAKIITTTGGANISYDRCVVAPGIGFRYDLIEGYDENIAATSVHHAWKAGTQTTSLRNQLEAMDDGGTFVMAAPPNPYRCPPAPYERASQVAHYFKKHKPASKILILDPKSAFAKQPLFEEGWMELYGYGTNDSMIERVSGADNLTTGLDVANKTATTADGMIHQADVLNIIPAQKAGTIAFAMNLTDDSGWCPINPANFESTLISDVHVIGDASNADPLPKSGFAANSEAKACALAVSAMLNGRQPERASFTNGCYSVVGDDYAISIVAVYETADDGKSIQKITNAGGMSPIAASDDERKVDVQYAYSWYNNFTKDVFD
ncbi:MAG: Sulfide dehydrogenase [flavocytochrome C] flavoprotein chain precursor (EC [uncultured Thiotrichaceae bacterium]|uniref:Sulfide dehydrogenase [flavocytochrome C] flavoprotein chain (EC) n=1 Tax=uncultured Thiotrichaceae bacterium TaxID=298394 RepID=A0A6S6U825_9GAMM|nr:MAG: Sulfide dehydrogenase [flavocytochrome C] flavoprotein chain precursor (EC [uncultured Thiotrichaceae bacterium]